MRLAPLFVLVAACGGDSTPAKMDAKKLDGAGSGSGTSTLVAVDCATNTPALTVTTSDLDMKYTLTPASGQINMGQIVKFQNSLEHDVKPNPIAPHTDPGLVVEKNQTKCFRFTATGAFGFMCSIHGFVATITVN